MLTQILSCFQISLIIAKLTMKSFEDISYWIIFTPAIILLILEYLRMFLTRTMVSIPKKNNNILLFSIIDSMLKNKNILCKTALCINGTSQKPQLLEYIGEKEPIQKLINNREYLNKLCDTRQNYFNNLILEKEASTNTFIYALLDDNGICMGFIALWNSNSLMLYFDEYLKKDIHLFHYYKKTNK